MKMLLGNTPVNSLNIHHFEMDTNDATLIPSDLQAGVTAYARGQKITGTGKSFEFANYGGFKTNLPIIIPSVINVVEIASTMYPIKSNIVLNEMKNLDFSIPQIVGIAFVNGQEYPISVTFDGMFLTFVCDQTITLQIFYGKDNYV